MDVVPVRLLAIYASPTGCYPPGTTIQVSELEAAQLIAGGYALPLDSLPPLPPTEQAEARETVSPPVPPPPAEGDSPGPPRRGRPRKGE